MKTMKKIFAAVVMVCVAFSLASCINDDEPKSYLRGHFVIEGSIRTIRFIATMDLLFRSIRRAL